ncbi:MAG TPA: hypothetical protein VE130_06040 [Nitrososphaeraceae archaeon]|jgi:hypothetical protein|nr:hypothetical protein [Nitrososphaeraceae archaeon]
MEVYGFLTAYNDNNNIAALDIHVLLLKDEMVLRLLSFFGAYKKATQLDALAILAQDDKFMKVADDLHKGFDKNFKMAMHLRTNS